MTTYKDLCSDCQKVAVCHFWLDLLKKENTHIIDHSQNATVSTIRIVYACVNYERPKANAMVIGSGYKPYIDKDKHEPETMAGMILNPDK